MCILLSPNDKIMPNLSRNGVMLPKFLSLAAPEAVILTATGAADDDIEWISRRRDSNHRGSVWGAYYKSQVSMHNTGHLIMIE